MNDPKIIREKNYHNKRFSEEVRQPAWKFYSIERKSRSNFRDNILNNAKGKTFLELGTGKGNYAFEIKDAGGIVTGIDISDVAVKYAQKQAAELNAGESLRFFVMNAEEINFSNQFDFVIGSSILHHLDLDKSLIGISRVLKENGKGIFIEPLGMNPLINSYRKRTPEFRTVDEHPLRKADFKIFSKYFDNVQLTFFHFTTLLTVPVRKSRIFNPLLGFFEFCDSILLKIPFIKYLSWQVVIVVSKPKIKN